MALKEVLANIDARHDATQRNKKGCARLAGASFYLDSDVNTLIICRE